MSRILTDAQRLKFRLLERGLTISPEASLVLRDATDDRQLTPADYASTSGIILRLEDDVWVNAPIAEYNPNFVGDTPFTLKVVGEEGLLVDGGDLSSVAQFWLPPRYHGEADTAGTPFNRFVFTHADRVRLAPVQGCAMACKFCNVPYQDRYDTKPIESMLAAVRVALDDPIQPARHMLISGGTPRMEDVPYLREVYRRVLVAFPDIDIDIMMAPVEGLLDVQELADLGIHELSINLEIFSPRTARSLMPQKFRQGIDTYLGFIEQAATVLGPGRVRSMLMVGLEPSEDTLEGVRAIIDNGGVPVLSPFRPDPSTPLHDRKPALFGELEAVFLRAERIADQAGTILGPTCLPCTHNTLTLKSTDSYQAAVYLHPLPAMV